MYHHGIGKAVLSKGAMDFCGSRFFYDTGGILGCDTGTGYDAQFASPYTATFSWFQGLGLGYQLFQ